MLPHGILRRFSECGGRQDSPSDHATSNYAIVWKVETLAHPCGASTATRLTDTVLRVPGRTSSVRILQSRDLKPFERSRACIVTRRGFRDHERMNRQRTTIKVGGAVLRCGPTESHTKRLRFKQLGDAIRPLEEPRSPFRVLVVTFSLNGRVAIQRQVGPLCTVILEVRAENRFGMACVENDGLFQSIEPSMLPLDTRLH